MKGELTREFRFEAAHRLPKVPANHKCGRMHGHSYRVVLTVAGPVDAGTGWLVDFAEIARAFEPVQAALDHRTLNEVAGLENPTAELLAAWIWKFVRAALPSLAAVGVYETESSGCTYRGE